MNIDGNKLTPGEGFKYISNGKVYSSLVYLGIYDSSNNWYDTNENDTLLNELVEENFLIEEDINV